MMGLELLQYVTVKPKVLILVRSVHIGVLLLKFGVDFVKAGQEGLGAREVVGGHEGLDARDGPLDEPHAGACGRRDRHRGGRAGPARRAHAGHPLT